MRQFAEFLWGLRVTHPAEYGRLLRLRSRIYRRAARLDAAVVRSPEPIRFADLDRRDFRPFRDGASWGGVFDCAWLRITGDVPTGLRAPELMLGIRGEGLVYSGDGTVLDAVSTVYQQSDLPHAGGRFRSVRGVDLSGGRVEVYADVTHNGFILYGVGKGVFHGAFLAERDDEAHALYYDYLTLVVLADATSDDRLERDLAGALHEAYARAMRGDPTGARRVLAPHLAAESTSEFVYTAIGHGHLDMAWLWPLRETHRKAARTYTRQLNNLDEHPEFLYGTSQPQQLQWIKDEHPALFARIKDAVAAGRIELQGAFWVEPDTNLPGGESLIRQALIGRRFYAREFGLTREQLRVCWLPDTFGYSGNLPQILRGTGMDFFQTIKLAWNKVNDFPHRTFRWEGIDGSSVLVHMPPEGDYNSRGAADGLLRGLAQYPERELGTALLVYGSGDGGGGPGEIHLELQRRERSLRGLPRVVPGTAEGFFRDLERREGEAAEWPRHRGELYLETHQGTYTTSAEVKRHNRRAERLLHDAEALAALTGSDSGSVLEPLWREVLLGQFHDIIPGSSIQRVNVEALAAYRRVEKELTSYIDRLVPGLPVAAPDAPTALNLTGFPRREHVRAADRWYLADLAPYSAAPLLPALDPPGLAATERELANGILTLRFGDSGEIVSCRDAHGGEHAGGGLNRLVLHEDPYVFPFNAWDIDPAYLAREPVTLRPHRVESAVDGPIALRRAHYRGDRVELVQTVQLEAGSSLVRFHTKVRWGQKHHMLRAEFRPSHFGDTAACEIQFGHIHRATTERDAIERAQFEVCAHKWLATGTDAGGFALVNDGKYGHRAKNGMISLNLLRAPTFPDPTIDRGDHEFTYGFVPLPPGDLAPAIAAGYRLNNPLRIGRGTVFESAVRVHDPGVVVETVKPAEAGGGIVLRLYESLGRATTTALSTTLAHTRAVRTDLLEEGAEPIDLDRLEFGPFQLMTILLEA